MKLYTTLVLLLVNCSLYGQWLSVEGGFLLNRKQVERENFEEGSFSNIRAEIVGVDTFYLEELNKVNQRLSYRVYDLYSFSGNVLINFPVSEKVIVSAGLGLVTKGFGYERRNFGGIANIVSVDTINYELDGQAIGPDGYVVPIQTGNGGSGGSEEIEDYGIILPWLCDTFPQFLGPMIPFRNPTYSFGSLDVVVPFSVSYKIFPGSLDLRLGFNANIPFRTRQGKSVVEAVRTDLHPPELDSLTVCFTRYNSYYTRPTPFLSRVTIDSYLGLDVYVRSRIRLSFQIGKYFSPLNRQLLDNPDSIEFNIPFKYRPSYGKLSLALDIGKKEKLRETKKKYMFSNPVTELEEQ